MNRDCCCTANLACLLPVVCSGRVQFFPPPFTLHPPPPFSDTWEAELWDWIPQCLSLLGLALVQSLRRVRIFETPWTTARQASLSFTISWSLLKLMSIESVIPSNHLILCCPLLLLPSIYPSIKVFSNESALCIRWPKYWSFSFSISPSSEYSGSISFRTDWFDLAVQETLKSLLQYHSWKASILQHSTFFIVQLSHPYMTTGKTIALTRWTFVGKVMSLLFNMLSRLVIAFLPRSKCLLISWLQSPPTVILEPKKIVCHSFHCFPIYLPWSAFIFHCLGGWEVQDQCASQLRFWWGLFLACRWLSACCLLQSREI